jgi:hypothetical protein
MKIKSAEPQGASRQETRILIVPRDREQLLDRIPSNARRPFREGTTLSAVRFFDHVLVYFGRRSDAKNRPSER